MTDIILLILATALGFMAGKYFEGRLRKRERLFFDLYRYVTLLKVNIGYRQLTLDEFIKQFSDSAVSGCFSAVMEGDFSHSGLKREEIGDVSAFLKGLGTENRESLEKHLEYYETVFHDALTAAQNDFKTKGKVCGKVGLLLGITLGLMLI